MPRQIEQNRNVPMYNCPNYQNVKVKCEEENVEFGGSLVVSMRPYRPENVQKVIDCTVKYPKAHGAPIHVGDYETLGISDLGKPDYGDAVDLYDKELPVFWACGVTTQQGLESAKLPFAITHAPGHMLVLDMFNSEMEI